MTHRTESLIGPLLQGFFLEHLLAHKQASPQTISSYRDTFRLLLQFIHRQSHIEPVNMQISNMEAPIIISFLDNLEEERHNSIRSRNTRLAAIRTFFRWVTLCNPEYVGIAARVMAIPSKRTVHKIVSSLSQAEVEAILGIPDLHHWHGRRDHALFLTLYNTGCRVSEIIKLEQSDVTFGETSFIHIRGKGRKERDVPIWNKTSHMLKNWFEEQESSITAVFPNARGKPLSRNGVNYLLNELVASAKVACPSLNNKSVTSHTFRHTTALHLLQSGVDISVIALWLGHESIETTHIYLEADLAMKERALQKLPPSGQKVVRYRPSDKVISFLSSL